MSMPALRRRTPITLWLHVAGDVWKLVLLTTAVLAMVIAFALAIKPLADGKLGPADTITFMMLATIPALQYVLPFAACFGATLAYHRLSTDNELTACHAAGISHRSLLIPALVSGVILGGALLGLSNYVIPRFFRSMAELVSQDAARLIVATIERDEAIQFNDMLVYADTAYRLGREGEYYEHLYLKGLFVARRDKAGNVTGQASAKSAHVWLQRVPGEQGEKSMTRVVMKPQDFVGSFPGARTMGADATSSFTIPDNFSDNVKFLTFNELRELRRHPERIDSVERHRSTLAVALGQRELVDAVRESLRTKGTAEFTDPFGETVVLRAGNLLAVRRDGKRDPRQFAIVPKQKGQPVIVDGPRRQSAGSAFLKLERSADPQKPGVRCTIQLIDVAAEEIGLGDDAEVAAPAEDETGEIVAARGEVKERPIADLSLKSDAISRTLELPPPALLTRVDARGLQRPIESEALAEPRARLKRQVDDLLREVVSKEHERYAMSAACLVMILAGAVMAMRLRDALPLTVYLWAFFPALATMVSISGGQQLAHGKGLIGLPVLWMGVIGLLILTVLEFRKLARH